MPTLCKTLPLQCLVTNEEWNAIQSGLLQDDRWKARIDDGQMHIFRKGTNICIFIVHWQQTDIGVELVDMIVNRDPEQYSNINDAHDVNLVNKVINGLMSDDNQYLLSMGTMF